MGLAHSSRQQSQFGRAVASSGKRRIGCASFFRSETLGARHRENSYWQDEDCYVRPGRCSDVKGARTLSPRQSKNTLNTVAAGLKTALAQKNNICSSAPPISQPESKSLSSLSTVDESKYSVHPTALVRPHSAADDHKPSNAALPYRRVNSVGSLQYTVRQSQGDADSALGSTSSQLRYSSAVSCSSIFSSNSNSRSRASSRSSCRSSVASCGGNIRVRALTSSTSSRADSGVFSTTSSRRSSSSNSSSRCVSRCSAERVVNSPSPLCRSSRSPTTTELVSAFAKLVVQRYPVARKEDVEVWVKNVDRSLIHSGWQEQPFLCAANAALVFAVFQSAAQTERVQTPSELRGLVLTCLYVAYSYGGHEISYPLKPFLYTQDRSSFWEKCMRIACSSSGIMLRVNQKPHTYQQILNELVENIY